jgi:hypothetical protein
VCVCVGGWGGVQEGGEEDSPATFQVLASALSED